MQDILKENSHEGTFQTYREGKLLMKCEKNVLWLVCPLFSTVSQYCWLPRLRLNTKIT